jgi:hypothetical protein
MPGLGPGIPVLRAGTKAWMSGTSPALTSFSRYEAAVSSKVERKGCAA